MQKDVGELRELVSVYNNAPTDAGDQLGVAIRTQWCRIEPAGGRAVEIGAVTGNLATHKITFRHQPTIAQGMWVVDQEGTKYEITQVKMFRRDRQEAYANVIHAAGTPSP